MKLNASEKIFSKLRGQAHYINDKCAYRYYNDFWNSINLLDNSGFFYSQKIINKFCDKLKIGKKYDASQFFQGVSEMMLWLYCCKQSYQFDIDVNSNGTNNTDVDLQILYNNYTINLEIKSPSLTQNIPDNILKINTGFRTVDKNRLNSEMAKVENDVISKILDNSDGKYKDFQYSKIDDTKVLSYLASCKTKFSLDKKDVINVLLIALPSDSVQDYWSYLYNPYSGIFTDNFPNRYYNAKEERYYNIEDIEMTDVIILSNLISGHLKPNDSFDSWDLNNYFNLLCMNIHSKKFKINKTDKGFQILYDLLPNDNKRFEDQWTKLVEYEKKNNILLDPIFVKSYLYDNYKLLY